MPRRQREESSAAITQTLVLIMAFSSLIVVASYGADPSWWSSPGTGSQAAVMPQQVVTNNGVVTTNYTPNPYGVVTQGQLKQFTARAVDELNSKLAGGAGSNLNSMVSNWAQDYLTNGYNATNIKPSDYTVMNIGQLKYIANKVYGRLSTDGYTNLAPSWLPQNTNSDNNVAVLGQLKQAFDFDFSLSSATNLTATPGAPGTINLSWASSGTSGAAPWVVEEQNLNGSWTYLTSLPSSNNSYSVSGLTNGQSYTFQVFASGTNNVSRIANASGTPSGSITPSLSPSAGRYISSQTVTVTSALTGGLIYYTTDGSDPTTNSLSVSSGSQLTVNSDTLYKFVAIAGGSQSPETTALYRIESAAVVCASDSFSMTAKSDGSIWTWGDNSRGQIGDDQSEGTIAVPKELTSFGQVTSLAAAGDHALAAKSDGTVWAWGADDESQCGDGGTTDLLAPTQIGLTNIVSVYAAQAEGFAVDSTGNLYAWGANSFGQLGNGTTDTQPTPQLISGISNVVKIAASPSHTLALKSDGTVWSCGTNQWNQLGDVTSSNTTVFQQILGLCNIIDIAAGGDAGGGGHSLALRADGAVFAWGIDFDGELGDDNPGPGTATPEQVLLPEPAVAVTAVDTKCYVLLADGTIKCFGGNPEGEMGNGNTQDQLSPAQPVGTTNNVRQISAGMFHAIAVTTTGALEGWGSNDNFQLTQDFNVNPYYERGSEVHDDLSLGFKSVVGAENTTMGLKPDGTVWATGEGYFGTTGQGNSGYAAIERFQQVSGLPGITQIAGGENDAFAIDVFGNLWAWGNNGSGQLGVGSENNSNVPSEAITVQNVVSVAGGTNHTLILESNGTVWATGDDSDQELGDGTTNAETSPIRVTGVSNINTVAAGSNTSFALDSTGAVWAWGANGNGQLGLGGTSDVAAPTKITSLPALVAISAWYNGAVGIDSSGNVWSWGDMGNSDGTPVEQSGLSNVVKVASGSGFQLAIDGNGNLWGWGNSGSGQLGSIGAYYSTPTQLGDFRGAIGIAANAASTLILKQDGTVSGLGYCSFGELAAQQGQYDYLPRSLYGVALTETPPTVSLTSPTAGASCPMGTAIQFQASASASSGTIAEVDYYLEGVKVASSTAGGTWNASYVTRSYGNYTFEAVAVDSAGVSTVSAPVTINVPHDSDGNGLPDWWELKYFAQLGNNPSGLSPSGDGNTLLQEFQAGIAPTTGVDATISIVSGNNQTGASGAFLANPLVVNVTGGDDAPLENTPVQFSVSQGNGLVGTAPAGLTYHTVTVTTDSNGMAEVYLQQPLVANSTSTVAVTVPAASNAPAVTFSATTPADNNAPAATSDLSAISVGNGEIDLSWTNNADNASNLLVQQQNTDGSWSTVATLNSNQDSYAATGLTVGNGYNFQVIAENSIGQASALATSAPIVATSTSQAPPQYVVVDMGAGLFPVKLTNSGNVLLQDGSGGFHRWAAGASSPLTVPNGCSISGVTDITEDGTVVGTGTDARGNPALLTWTGTATVAATSGISGASISGAYIDAQHDILTIQTPEAYPLDTRGTVPPDGYFDNSEIGQDKFNVSQLIYGDYLYFYYVLGLEGGIPEIYRFGWTTGNSIVPLGVNRSGTSAFVRTDYYIAGAVARNFEWTWPDNWPTPGVPPAPEDEPNDYTTVGYSVNTTPNITYFIGSGGATSGTQIPAAPTSLNNDGCAICNGQLVNGPAASFPSGFSARSLNAAHNSSGKPAYGALGYDDAGDLQFLQMDPQNQTFDQNAVNVSTLLSTSDAALWTSLSPYFGFGLSQVINDSGAIVGTATYSGTNTAIAQGSHGVLLLPIELDLVNRDDLTKTWTANEQKQGGLVTVYAGTTTGDEVEWKIDGASGWSGSTFTWTATDSQGNVINGPTGVGVDHWQISDTGGNDPASNTTLTWKPDTYTIKCNIVASGGGTIPVQFTQKVGWRTEDYVVIGQIVNNITFQNSGPANSTDSTLYRAAITTDCAATFTLGAGLTGGLSSLASTALPDSAFGFIEFSSWGVWPHALTPQGPLWYAGAVTEGDRYWMYENALNASVDTPTVAGPSDPPMTATQLSSTETTGNYRIYHHYQTRFTLTSAGKIDTTSFYDIHNDGITGQTKFNIPAGAFNPAWNNPDIPLFTVAAQTNPIDSVPNQGHTQTSSDGTKHSSYASGRVGSDGQNVNWHVMGQDVPWIFSEIICQVASDHTVTSNIEMSVNTDWQDSGTVSGTVNFNNLNIYKAVFTPATGSLNYTSQKLLPMEGQLQSFILSVPLGTWPTPPTTPSVQ